MSITRLQIERTAVKIPLGRINLAADIAVPSFALGLVVFAHGSGSGRHSPRNRHVAEVLNRGGIATILIDLLTEQEESVDIQTSELRFDIGLLARRLVAISDWIGRQPRLCELGLGSFGASTGAAAALVAAAEQPDIVQAVVSRGGRPDLAGDALRRVAAPTLFIVGSRDPVVLDLNYAAIARLPRKTEHKLEIVSGASHLFEEAGTLDQVAILATDWFQKHLHSRSCSVTTPIF
jgi:putative phosphoribosyl transferase